ncbi:hypothetical protein FISHEDRAFT_61196 [Fistulina hepatica ATCC 64428]|uniref:Uncharacterized protein n=1 Tax=Fistulina hepatica ATCC 64428 TaxID=1128425 RepID=A0A0D7A430_9AGAR|nr:hypothetical protein FISHEDRAFT_61196 [Fistulina hepatica ATCC 64428]
MNLNSALAFLDEEDIKVEEEQYVETSKGQAETGVSDPGGPLPTSSQPGPSETGPESKGTPKLDYSPDGSDLDASLEAAFSEDSHAESQEATTLERCGIPVAWLSESTVEGNEVAPEADPLSYGVDPSFFPKATEEQYAAALVHGRSVHRPSLLRRHTTFQLQPSPSIPTRLRWWNFHAFCVSSCVLLRMWDSDPQVYETADSSVTVCIWEHSSVDAGVVAGVQGKRAPLERFEASMMATAEQGKFTTAQKEPARMQRETKIIKILPT